MKGTINFTAVIRLVVLALLALWAFFIVTPFIGALTWAMILAVAIYPFFKSLITRAGEKRKSLVTTLFTIMAVAMLAVPSYSIFSSVLETTSTTVQQFRGDTLQIPPPSENVKDWPFGEKIYGAWLSASTDIQAFAIANKDFIKEEVSGIVNSFLGIMGTLVLFIVSLIIAVVFMYNADGVYSTTVKFANKLVGKEGEEVLLMSRNTIRSVVKGILLVALIQAILSFIGFKLIGLPAAGIFTMVVLFAAIIQLPVTLAVIPAIILAFSISDNTTYTIIFAVYIFIVSILDNVLKPILLAKGLQTPTVFIFLGAIGGVLLHGLIGLFVGPVILALTHRFYMYWVNSPEEDLD